MTHRCFTNRPLVVDEQLLNRLSGGDSIAVRTLHKTHEREQPMHGTMMMLMNEMFPPCSGNAATKALFLRVKGVHFPVQFKTEDDPEHVADDPHCAVKDPSLKDKLRTGPAPESGGMECRDALLYMLLDLVPALERGNTVKIPARVRNYTGEVAAESDPGQAALQVVAKKQPGNFKHHVQDYRCGGKEVAKPDPDGRPLLVTSSQAHRVLKKYMEIQYEDSKWSKAKTDKLLKQACAAQGYAEMKIAKGKKAGARQWALPGFYFALDDPDLRRNSEDEDQWQFRAMAWNSDEEAHTEVTEVLEEAEPEPEPEVEIEIEDALATTIKVSLDDMTRKTSKTIELGYVEGETRGDAVDWALVKLGLEASCSNTNPDRVKSMDRGGVAQGHFATIDLDVPHA